MYHQNYNPLGSAFLSTLAAAVPGHAAPGLRDRWLWRTLHGAELAGLDPAQVLADAVAERDLAGVRDITAVIDARIRDRTGTFGPRWPKSEMNLPSRENLMMPSPGVVPDR